MTRVKRLGFSFLVAVSLMFFSGIALAGGTISYTDGSPAAGAQLIISGGGQGKTVVTCDQNGRFELDTIPADARVRVKANSKDYASLKLPASLFSSGNVAIVLQPKSAKQKSHK